MSQYALKSSIQDEKESLKMKLTSSPSFNFFIRIFNSSKEGRKSYASSQQSEIKSNLK